LEIVIVGFSGLQVTALCSSLLGFVVVVGFVLSKSLKIDLLKILGNIQFIERLLLVTFSREYFLLFVSISQASLILSLGFKTFNCSFFYT